MTTSNTPLQRKRGRLKKLNGLCIYQVAYNVAFDRKEKENFKGKEELEKQDDNAQAKKKGHFDSERQ